SETQVVANGLPPVAMPRSDKASELPTEAAWVKSLAMPNLPLRLDGRVIKYLQFYRDSAQGKAIASVWAKKSGRYIPALKAEFAKAGLPTDLVWLSVIESGHNPTIISPAGAAGLWQFGAQTARTYGLVVDRWVDERFEPFRATQAASRYLYDLHQRFGSWELAMAAYNMGHGGIQHAIEKFNTNDFWELSRYEAALPWETALYVPKILAVAIVMNNRAAFGIDGVTPDPPTSFDTVLVEPAVSLEKVAQAAGLSTTEVQALNPQYVSGRTPPMAPGTAKRTWPIQLPLNTGATVSTWLAKHAESKDSAMPYVVRFGDTVESIALSLDSTEERLRSLNRIAPEEALQPGTVLLVPKNQGSLPLAAPSDNVVVVAAHSYEYPDRKRVFYRVLVGDTLNRIAEAFSVSRGELITWNSLDESARLQSGMTLQIFVKQSTNLDRVAHIEEASVRILTAGSPEFCDYFEGLKGRKRMVVKALTGETLNGVARRYGMTGGWIERVNHRSRREKLNAGETVIVYVDRHVPAPGGRPTETARQELRPARPPRPDALPAASSSSLTEAPAPKASEKKD
ncbi:MAG TPA: LysM peptidoglycan-binding domain-containing protein, partial [Polyangiaceae bacterium]